MMKIAIIINASRVTQELVNQLEGVELKEKYHIDYDVFIKKPEELEDFFNQLKPHSYNAYIIAGGDGTVRTSVERLINEETPLGFIPLGTFNFLATELNHPKDLDALFAMIKNNKLKKIDLGVVNERVFINHAWLGFYTRILQLREKYKDFLGTNKLFKIVFNMISLFKPIPTYHLKIVIDNQTIHLSTCLVYIGNNDHQANLLDFGEKKSLSAGLLSINILNCHNRWDLFKCAIQILLNQSKDSEYITKYLTDDVVITSKNKTIHLVLDGELVTLVNPLNFTVYKKQLTVFIP